MTDEHVKLVERDEVEAALDEAHLMLGRAVSDWGKVEEALCHVFASCFPLLASAPAGHAFHEPRSFDTKSKMTSRAALIAVGAADDPEAFAIRWDETRKGVEKLSLTRNKLAHGSVAATLDQETGEFSVRFEAFRSARRYNEAASKHIAKKHRRGLWGKEPTTFSAFGMHAIAADFYSMSKELNQFARDLRSQHR